jgi:hypothetical protein
MSHRLVCKSLELWKEVEIEVRIANKTAFWGCVSKRTHPAHPPNTPAASLPKGQEASMANSSQMLQARPAPSSLVYSHLATWQTFMSILVVALSEVTHVSHCLQSPGTKPLHRQSSWREDEFSWQEVTTPHYIGLMKNVSCPTWTWACGNQSPAFSKRVQLGNAQLGRQEGSIDAWEHFDSFGSLKT